MRIAQISPLWIPVPPFTYGGTELIVSWLTEELIRRGHEVTLFTTGDSKTSARLIPIWPKSLWRARLTAPHAVFSLMYQKVIELQDEFDVIHDHCEFYTTPYVKFLKPPIITTLHHPLTKETILLYKRASEINFVAISKNQKRTGPGINIVKTIYHGLPLEKYEFNEHPQDYLLWLSKITPKKGPAEAIEIARRSGHNLLISGPILPVFADFFEYRLKPLIDGKQIRYVGTADFKKKIELFKNAKALLFPIRWAEPFGLVVIEAMACGTPVITYREGSMPELVLNGKTGFLVNSVEEACWALKKIDRISRKACREHIEKNFKLSKMVNRYEKLYKKVIRQKKKK